MKHYVLVPGCWAGLARFVAASIALLSVGLSIPGPGARTVHGQAQTTGRHYYVSPSGLPTNDGSADRPLNLATAMGRTSPARAGDVIWLRGGTYRGAFVSDLTGTASSPIIVRQYPGERATIDSSTSALDALTARGAYTWFWGFEITSSDPKRVTSQSGSWPSDLRRGYGAVTRAPGIKFINLVIHDNANGIGIWSESVGGEAYGNVVYYNGWEGPDRAHGHGIYTQNQTGSRRLAENILFKQFSHGIHAYGSSSAALDNITAEGNISFMNGALSSGGIYSSGREILLGGERTAANPVLDGNSTYAGQTNFGYNAGCTNGRMTNNYFAGAVLLAACNPTVTGNTFYDENWPRYGTWPTQYPQNTYHSSLPAGPIVRIRPNTYEPGRANVAVYNWGHAPEVSLDLSRAGLSAGAAYQIRDAQNYFGAPVASGTYDGTPVRVPMTGLTATRPVGNVPSVPAHTAPEFAVFVVVPSAGPAAPSPGAPAPAPTPTPTPLAPTASISLSTGSIAPGQSATLRWSTTNASAVSIAPGIGSVAATGSVQVAPSATTTYTITARADDGQVATSNATLAVSSSPTTPTGSVTVRLTSPTDGAVVVNQSTVTLTADVTDPAGEVTKVEFYRGPTNIGTSWRRPFTLQWTHVVTGSYVLTARAYNSRGVVATSAPVTIRATQPPTVRLTAPVAGTLAAPASITVTAAATDYDGGVARVEFYRGSTLIGQSTRAPFGVTWTAPAAGAHVLTARAYDNLGLSTTSAPVSVTITH